MLFRKGKTMKDEPGRDWALLLAALLIGLMFFVCAVLQGCHTVHGIGQDLQDMTSDYTER
jgi:predicted small secreted protein